MERFKAPAGASEPGAIWFCCGCKAEVAYSSLYFCPLCQLVYCSRCMVRHARANDDFWAKVDVRGEGDCWLWRGPVLSNGYGRFLHKPLRSAHRASYTLANGAPEDGLWVLHRCDTPLCVNPAHLFLGTCLDNIADRHAKGRDARGDRTAARLYPERRPRGLQHGRAKLDPEKVARIHALRDGGSLTPETITSLAGEFGVSKTAIRLVAKGINWRKGA